MQLDLLIVSMTVPIALTYFLMLVSVLERTGKGGRRRLLSLRDTCIACIALDVAQLSTVLGVDRSHPTSAANSVVLLVLLLCHTLLLFANRRLAASDSDPSVSAGLSSELPRKSPSESPIFWSRVMEIYMC